MSAPVPDLSDDWWSAAALWIADRPELDDSEAFDLVCATIAHLNGVSHDDVARGLCDIAARCGASTPPEVVALLRFTGTEQSTSDLLDLGSGLVLGPPPPEVLAHISDAAVLGVPLSTLLTSLSDQCGVTADMAATWVRELSPDPRAAVEDAYESLRVVARNDLSARIAAAADQLLRRSDRPDRDVVRLLGSGWDIGTLSRDNAVQRQHLEAWIGRFADELGLPGDLSQRWQMMQPVFAAFADATPRPHPARGGRGQVVQTPADDSTRYAEPEAAQPQAGPEGVLRTLTEWQWHVVEAVAASSKRWPDTTELSFSLGAPSDLIGREIESIVRRLGIRKGNRRSYLRALRESVVSDLPALRDEVSRRQAARLSDVVGRVLSGGDAGMCRVVGLLATGDDLCAIARQHQVPESELAAWVTWFGETAGVHGDLSHRWNVLRSVLTTNRS
ncbi:hypothetical protein [Lentzea sp. E54]|uniref:hypothetical protein n=1 Tax=Lentzea xerophila TaxID=3435883 RepID=UPI003DA6187C